VQYLTRQRNDETEAWWTNAIAAEDVPIVVRDLLRERHVVAAREEIGVTLAWARALPGWNDAHPPLLVLDELP
jgi:hypothetical protein